MDVTVQPAGPALTTTKAAGTVNATVVGDADLQAGDTITYTITADNTGNVSMSNIVPNDTGITFGGVAGTGTFSFSPASHPTLAPTDDAPVTFTATYTLSTLDILRGAAAGANGVSNTATSTGTFDGTDTTSLPSAPGLATIQPDPELVIVKTAALQKVAPNIGVDAEVGDTILYTYVISNTGNVAIDDVKVNDTHEGTPLLQSVFVEDEATLVEGPLANSADASQSGGTDGNWDTLAAGASVTFTYTHTVTQTEYDNQ